MSDAESSQPKKLPPLGALPKFNRRLLRPGSAEYEKPELGKPCDAKEPSSKTATNPPAPSKSPGGLKRRENRASSLLESMLGLKITDEPTTTPASNGKGNITNQNTCSKLSDREAYSNHKIAQLHRPQKFKQIVKNKPVTVKKEGIDSDALEARQWLDKILDEDLEKESEEVEFGDDKKTPELKVAGLVPRLMPHQVVGVKFLSRRERSSKYAKGGLLADLMGLGKTVQSIALILHKPPPEELKASKGSRVTLVVAPLTVMDQWKDEIKRMAPTLRVKTHQGSKRVTDSEDFINFDVVVTTYDVVSSEFSKSQREETALFGTSFYRIIADEAHTFRNEKTRVSQAMMALKTLRSRWALTGTPIHNSVEDILTLLKFIGIERNLAPDDPELKKMLKTLVLRRTQKVLKGALPPIEMEKRPVKLAKEEQSAYDIFDSSMRSGEGVAVITSMRLACNGIASTVGLKVDSYAERETKKNNRSTSSKILDDSSGEINEDDALAAMLGNMKLFKDSTEKGDDFWGSKNSKVLALRDILSKDRKRKTIVFSSFVTMLHALRPMLDHEGISHSMYIGSMTVSQRESVLEKFRDEKSGITVLLCSLHATAVGLNLTSASQVVLIEPWWNPQISDQAIKRVHRLGQKRVVNCIELFAKNTLEERILIIQNRKRKEAKNMLHATEKMSQEERHFMLYGDEE